MGAVISRRKVLPSGKCVRSVSPSHNITQHRPPASDAQYRFLLV